MELWKEHVEERILSSHLDGASMFEIIFMPPFSIVYPNFLLLVL
jgi:hypothetical protein